MPLEEKIGLCALNKIFGFEPRICLELLQQFGSAIEIFRQSKSDVERILGAYSKKDYASFFTTSAYDSAAIELETLKKDGCTFIGFNEVGYPEMLAECYDAPIGIYFKGVSPPEEVFNQRAEISVVGTREVTSYGREWCKRLVGALGKASKQPLIVSGLALGVDVTAHKAALDAGIPTVAVMATGIDTLYPTGNRIIGEQIAGTEGCALITDYPPGTEALRVHFLRRNRIIAGISRATVLIESRVKGGGMMTANLAASYDRDVYALPGRVDDPMSQGCNLLICENIASPVGDLVSFVKKLGLGKTTAQIKEDFVKSVESHYLPKLSAEELTDVLKVAKHVKKTRGVSLDDLCAKFKWPFSKVSHVTSILECDGFISIDLLQHCSISSETSHYTA